MRRYAQAAVVSDLASMVLSLVLVHALGIGSGLEALSSAALLLMPVTWVFTVWLGRGHRASELGIGAEEYRSLLWAGLVLMSALAFASLTLESHLLPPDVARGLAAAVPVALAISLIGRYVLRRRVHALRASGRCMRVVVAVGRERAVLELVRQLRRDRHCGMEVRAACVPDPRGADMLRQEGVAVLGDLTQVMDIVRTLGASSVAVTSTSETAAVYLRQLSWELEGSGVELLVAPGLMEIAGPRMHIRPFIGLPLLHVDQPEFTGGKRVLKGALDRIAAAAALLILAPVLLLVAVAVRMDGTGPVLFRQTRIGQGGREFSMLKFRTMVPDAEQRLFELREHNRHVDGPLFKIAADPRVTRVGRVLRRYSLDELPQLLNVLGGQMSLVGPRPPLPSEVALYDTSASRRLLVKPGLTGLWQVSGRSDLTWDESVRLDLRYVENWSLLLDVMILWKTGSAVLRARGAY
jgi:exopolysaccharide biosynthesis polyprenyl glycosylphosphotransferase